MNIYGAIQKLLPITIMLQNDQCRNLHGGIQDKNDVVAKGDKDSRVLLIKNLDCVIKKDTIVGDGIVKDTYIKTAIENTLKELLQFQDFLYRNYKGMKPGKINQHVFM